MKETIITDFLDYDKNDSSPKKYLELPTFDKKFNFKKNIVFYKQWNDYKKKIIDIKINLKLLLTQVQLVYFIIHLPSICDGVLHIKKILVTSTIKYSASFLSL